jgi:hypothetical protein
MKILILSSCVEVVFGEVEKARIERQIFGIISFFDRWSEEMAASFGDDVLPRRASQHHLVFPAIAIHYEH